MITLMNEPYVLSNLPGIQTKEFAGLSTDTKPTADVPNGSTFFEMDTSTAYMFDESSSSWKAL